METAFEQAYQENHRKGSFNHRRSQTARFRLNFLEPIPIVLMNEEDIPQEKEEEAASDRILVAEIEENPSPEYRMATITPSVNTVPVADEAHDDDEATLADPTIITLQTPLPDPQAIRQQQQQNMHRLMEKIER